jgi:O-antigen ligase
MTSTTLDARVDGRGPLLGRYELAVLCGLAVGASVVVGHVAAGGSGLIAVLLVLALPVVNWLLRRPVAAVGLWLLITPLVVATDGGALRRVYWVSHRLLPVVAVAVIVLVAVARTDRERLPRLGWPELAMAGYLAVSLLSVLHTADDPLATSFELYDRVVAPMALYLVVRLVRPGAADLRRAVPVLVAVLAVQALIGLFSWVAPEVLPDAWSGRVGTRTTGSLRHPNVYGTTALIAGLFSLHYLLSRRTADGRVPMMAPAFMLALTMAFMTYSRASWLAAGIVLIGVVLTYPRFGTRFLVVAGLVTALVLSSGIASEQVRTAQTRFLSAGSEHSALSRLPVIHASLRMVEQKPFTGWGYGNFDRYSPDFQRRVGTLIVPDREHASHNLYLTIASEQGIPGLVLYLGPAVFWLLASRRAWRRLPQEGLVNRQLLAVLWLALASHVVVNNYSNMKVVYGLGLWWLVLGVVAAIVSRTWEGDEEGDQEQDPAVGDGIVPHPGASGAPVVVAPVAGGRR